METKAITAIFAVALIAFGGVGVTVAMPEDLVGWDTPSERAYVYADHLNDLEESMLRQGMSEFQVSQRMNVYMYRYQMKLAKYTRMYNYINITELTTDADCEGTVEVENIAFSVGNSSFSLGAGTFSYKCNGDITVEVATLTVTATATAFDETAQTATLTNVVIYLINGYTYNAPGIYQVSW